MNCEVCSKSVEEEDIKVCRSCLKLVCPKCWKGGSCIECTSQEKYPVHQCGLCGSKYNILFPSWALPILVQKELRMVTRLCHSCGKGKTSWKEVKRMFLKENIRAKDLTWRGK